MRVYSWMRVYERPSAWQELFSDPALVAARIRAAFDRAVRLAR